MLRLSNKLLGPSKIWFTLVFYTAMQSKWYSTSALLTSRVRFGEEVIRGTTGTVTQIHVSPFVARTGSLAPCQNDDCRAIAVCLTNSFTIIQRQR